MAKSRRGRGKRSSGNSGSNGRNCKRTRSKDQRVARRITKRTGRIMSKRIFRKMMAGMSANGNSRQDIQEGREA